MSLQKKPLMPDKVTYEYVIIRVVPRVEREEFINVGVMVFSKQKKYLGIKYLLDEKRLQAFPSEIDVQLLNSYLHAWEAVCSGSPAGGPIGELELPVRFRWLAAHRSTILQTSRIHPGLCDQPAAVLEDLYRQYVL